MDDMQKIVNSLVHSGFQITATRFASRIVWAVGQNGEEVIVTLLPSGLCKVSIDGMIFTEHAAPWLAGESARLRRHVGVFE